MLETAHNHGIVCQKMRTDTSFLTANMSHSAFAESKTMQTFHPDMSTYVKSCTRTSPRKSKWCRVISWSVVVVSRSSWLVVLHGQSLFHVPNEGPVWWRHESVLKKFIDYYYGEKFDIGLNKKIRLTIGGRCSGSWCWCVWCRKIALKAVLGFLLCWNSRGEVGYW